MAVKAVQKLAEVEQTALHKSIEKYRGTVFETERELRKTLGPVMSGLGLTVSVQKAVLAALAVRSDHAPVLSDRAGNPEPDPEMRDNENVPLPEVPLSFVEDPTERLTAIVFRTAITDYMRDEVLPYVPDAWVEHSRTKIGYELPLTQYFYKFIPPRSLQEIDSQIKELETEIQRLLAEVTG